MRTRFWAMTVLLGIALFAVLSNVDFFPGDSEIPHGPLLAPMPPAAQAWSAVNALKGTYFNAADTTTAGGIDWMVRFDGSNPGNSATGGVSCRYLFLSLGAKCTLTVYSKDIPGSADSVEVISHGPSLGGDLVLPAFKSGIDSVRLVSAGASGDFVVWGMI